MTNKKIIDGTKSAAKSENQNGVKETPIIVSISVDDIMAIEERVCKKHNEEVITSKRRKYVGKVEPIDNAYALNEWKSCTINRTDFSSVYFIRVSPKFKNRYIEYHYRKHIKKGIGDKLLEGIEDVIDIAMVREDGSVYLKGFNDKDIVTTPDRLIHIDWRLMWLPDGSIYNSGLIVRDL